MAPRWVSRRDQWCLHWGLLGPLTKVSWTFIVWSLFVCLSIYWFALSLKIGSKQLNLPVEQMNFLILQKCFYSLIVNVDVNWILMIILILILELIFILGMYHICAICAIRPYGHSDIYSGANINVQVCARARCDPGCCSHSSHMPHGEHLIYPNSSIKTFNLPQ